MEASNYYANVPGCEDYSNEMDYGKKTIVLGFGGLSMILSSLVFRKIWNDKELGAHPQKLLALMCLTEAIQSWSATIYQICAEDVICYTQVHLDL
jgi:hypothetical protein